MSLNKAIERKKEKRKIYRGSKTFDRTCRNHGSCYFCRSNRLHKFKRKEPIIDSTEFSNVFINRI